MTLKGASTGAPPPTGSTSDVLPTNACSALKKAGADGVCGVIYTSRGLNVVGKGLAHDVRGNAVDQQIAKLIRRVVQAVKTREIGNLAVKAVDRSLQRQHAVLRILNWFSVSSAELKVVTPNALVTFPFKPTGCAGVLGIRTWWLRFRAIRLSRVYGYDERRQ